MTLEPTTEALALFQAGRLTEAAALLESVCTRGPGNAHAWFLLGACRHALRDLAAALSAFDRVIALDAANLQAALAAIAVLCDAGRPAEALARCEQLLARHPENAQLQFSTGFVHEALVDFSGALKHYESALAIDPGFFPALQNRGIALTRLGRMAEAMESNRQFAALFPERVEAHHNLAESCLAARRYDEAIAASRRALAIDPTHALAQLDLGLALAASGRLKEACDALRHATLRDDPALRARIDAWAAAAGVTDPVDVVALLQPEDVFLMMGCERLDSCDWDGLDAFADQCFELIRAAPPDCLQSRSLAFKLLHLPVPVSLHRIYADRVATGMVRLAAPLAKPARRPRFHQHRLRIGYLSGDFGAHPIGYLTRSMYALHDRGRFEVFGYALAGDDGSDNYRAIASACERMTDARSLSLEQLAERIAANSIDILVDLGGYTRGGRSHVLALRPAPIQVVYAGYPATLGAANLGGSLADYFIADGTAVPPAAESIFAEKVVRLPHGYLPASHRSYQRAPTPTRRDECLPEQGIIFCAFHRHEKIDPAAFRSWMRILDAVPDSVLWLQQGAGEANLRRHAGSAGIDAERLIFAPHRSHPAHLARQRLADLFLDTRRWNAHTTGADALWSGVPIITCPGEILVARLGASLLHAIGLDELAVKNAGEYEALAIDLATHPDRLHALKAKLARNRETHPLFDTGRLVRNLDRAFLEMWRIHESGQQPRSFNVEESGSIATFGELR